MQELVLEMRLTQVSFLHKCQIPQPFAYIVCYSDI